jgi:hypothetical protein
MSIIAGLKIGRQDRILQVNEIDASASEAALRVEWSRRRLDETGIMAIGYNASKKLVKALQASIHSGAMLHCGLRSW